MPVNAVSSKLLAQRWDEETYRQHMERMKNASSTLDTTAPKKYPHLLLSLKKLLIEEERQTRYHNENKVLMDKIRDIVKGRGTLDQRDDHEKAKSLNAPYVAKRRERIRKENLLMLRRLKGVVSTMTHTQWEGDYRRHLSYKDMLRRTTKDYKYRLPPISRAAKAESKAEDNAASTVEDSHTAALADVEEENDRLADTTQLMSPAVIATPQVDDSGTDVATKSAKGRGETTSTEKESWKGNASEVGRRDKGASESVLRSDDSPKKPVAQAGRKKKAKVKAKAAAAPTAVVAEAGEVGETQGATGRTSTTGKPGGADAAKREPTETSFLPRIDDKQGLVSKKTGTADAEDNE